MLVPATSLPVPRSLETQLGCWGRWEMLLQGLDQGRLSEVRENIESAECVPLGGLLN